MSIKSCFMVQNDSILSRAVSNNVRLLYHRLTSHKLSKRGPNDSPFLVNDCTNKIFAHWSALSNYRALETTFWHESVRWPIRLQWAFNYPKLHLLRPILISHPPCMLWGGVCSLHEVTQRDRPARHNVPCLKIKQCKVQTNHCWSFTAKSDKDHLTLCLRLRL